MKTEKGCGPHLPGTVGEHFLWWGVQGNEAKEQVVCLFRELLLDASSTRARTKKSPAAQRSLRQPSRQTDSALALVAHFSTTTVVATIKKAKREASIEAQWKADTNPREPGDELPAWRSQWAHDLTPNVGVEPTAFRLRVWRSTDWASRAIWRLLAPIELLGNSDFSGPFEPKEYLCHVKYALREWFCWTTGTWIGEWLLR